MLCERFQSFVIFNIVLFPGETSAQTIVPLVGEMHVSEGDKVTLSCNYSGTTYPLQWYRQFPRSRPEFLLYVTLQGTMSDPRPPRMFGKVFTDKRQVDLEISSAAVSDSAL